jgi:hypothetical protein
MSSASDVSITAVGSLLGAPAPKAVKPSYLVFLEETSTSKGKTTSAKKIISLDTPGHIPGFIQLKGWFCDLSEEEIVAGLPETAVPPSKEAVQELLIPWHKISYVRSLAFRAK